jgi:hypothetical protein
MHVDQLSFILGLVTIPFFVGMFTIVEIGWEAVTC